MNKVFIERKGAHWAVTQNNVSILVDTIGEAKVVAQELEETNQPGTQSMFSRVVLFFVVIFFAVFAGVCLWATSIMYGAG